MNPRLRPLFLPRFERSCGVLTLPLVAFLASFLAFAPHVGFALPTGGQVVAGQVNATFTGTQLTLDQASSTAIMHWQQFNIAPNELVRILQSGPDAALLARVTGGDPSQLLGSLQADGKVFLINPRGILVGQGAMIDTAAFIASTLDVADADFLKQGALTFKGDAQAGVVNLGRITAREGNVLLLARTVTNAGEIAAPRGTAGLAAGTEVYLASPDAPGFVVKTNLTTPTGGTGVENSGVITAAQAQLEAAGGSLFDLAVNQSGRIHVNGVERRPDGRILLTAAGGNVLVTGAATARDAQGGGGEILIGGDYQGKNSAVANATNTQVASTAVIDADAASPVGDGGRVIVWADNATRYLGHLSARGGANGGDGGFAEVSGRKTLGFHGVVDLKAAHGRAGTLLLDPDSITVIAGAADTLPPGLELDPTWAFADDAGSQVITNGTINHYLLENNLTLQATSGITVDAPIANAAGGDPAVVFTLQADAITLNAGITLQGANPTLRFLKGNGATSLASSADGAINARNIEIIDIAAVELGGAVTAEHFTYGSTAAGSSFAATRFVANHAANAIANLSLGQVGPQVSFASSGATDVRSSTAMTVSARIFNPGSGPITFVAGGNLTMAADTSLVSSLGDVKLASTGGVFINQASGNALLPAGNGGKYIYTTTTEAGSGYTLNGLTLFTEVAGVAFPDLPLGGLRRVFVSGVLPSLTITADSFIKFYGEPDPVFTARYTGGTAANLTVLPSFSILQGAHANVGTYTIVPAGAASATHNLSYVNGTLRIDPVTLTYVAHAANRLYRGADPAFGGTVTGFVNGDTLASATTGALTFSPGATTGSDAGSYAITGSGLAANHGNYVFTQAAGNATAFTIGKAPLTLIGATQTSVYGSVPPVLGYTVTGFLGSDTAAQLAGVNVGRAYTSTTPVGTYAFSFESVGSARNYEVTQVIPGSLTITPAPLTLRGNALTSVYGNTPPALGYSVIGLMGTDTASVLSGVSFDTAFFNTISPGTHSYGFASRGTAQNYVVTEVIPGTLTVGRRPLTVTAGNASSIAGVIPPLTSALTGSPVLGGPGFAIQFLAFQKVSAVGYATTPTTLTAVTKPGDYLIRPVVVPTGGATAAQVQAAYNFSLVDGTLTLATPAVSPTALTQATSVSITGQPQADDGLLLTGLENVNEAEIQENLKKIDYSTKSDVSVQAGSMALTPAQLVTLTQEFGPAIMGYIPGLLDDAVEDHAQNALLRKLQSGELSLAQFSQLVAADPEARAIVMPLLAMAMMDTLQSGRPLSPTQETFAARLATHIGDYRQTLKQELIQQRAEYVLQKDAGTVANQYALKTMPDIAISAQQAATEQAVAGVIGVQGGLVVGSALAALVATKAVSEALFPFATAAGVAAQKAAITGSTVAGTGSAAGGSAATVAVGMIATAVALIAVGVVSTVMVVQEQNNINAYNQTMDRANTPVNKDLSNLDLGDDKTKSEFFAAFMMSMLETGFNGKGGGK